MKPGPSASCMLLGSRPPPHPSRMLLMRILVIRMRSSLKLQKRNRAGVRLGVYWCRAWSFEAWSSVLGRQAPTHSTFSSSATRTHHTPFMNNWPTSIHCRRQRATPTQAIWRWRHGMADTEMPWTEALACSALRGSVRSAYLTVSGLVESRHSTSNPLRRMLHGLQRLQLDVEPSEIRAHHTSTDQFLLFFDGGSRGNPGPGGSGAVIVRVDAFGGNPNIVWAAAMSLAHTATTNNQAEYHGLVTGLTYASKQHLQPLTVIGDSAMIIHQLREHRAPKDKTLRSSYSQARVMADVMNVTKWHHHVRAYNKMADWAANLAMDSRTSVQTPDPSARACWRGLQTYLLEDVAQWQVSTPQGPTSSG